MWVVGGYWLDGRVPVWHRFERYAGADSPMAATLRKVLG